MKAKIKYGLNSNNLYLWSFNKNIVMNNLYSNVFVFTYITILSRVLVKEYECVWYSNIDKGCSEVLVHEGD